MTASSSRYEASQSLSKFAMKTILFAVAGLVIGLGVACSGSASKPIGVTGFSPSGQQGDVIWPWP